MIATLGAWLSDKAQRYVPDPLVLAIGLTALAAALALPLVGWSPTRVADIWINGSGSGKGVWNLLAFSMQMCLILVTGYALATTPLVRALVEKVAQKLTTTRKAVALVSLVTMGFAFLNWGLGLIVGAMLAREVGRVARKNNYAIHYPLVVAGGYVGLMVWHGGFSGSAPLKVTSAEQLAGVLPSELASQLSPMLLGDTIGSPLNLTVSALLLVGVPLALAAMAPQPDHSTPAPPDPTEKPDQDDTKQDTTQNHNKNTPSPQQDHNRPGHWLRNPAPLLDRSPLIIAIPVLLGGLYLYGWLRSQGLGKLNPNIMNLAMLCGGMALHGSVKRYVAAVSEGVKSCAGIILQYPFYAGIMGIMAGSGMVAMMGAALSGLGPRLLAVATFYLAGLVNLFVPSGGGQWAVQGPIVMDAALKAGADPSKVLLALCYGDQWTNMVQPFWALPLLGICRIKASRIIGYTALLMFISQLFFVIPLLLF